MGCSNSHSHRQIWATGYIPDEVRCEDEEQQRYHASHGSGLLHDYVQRELASGGRLVIRTEHRLAVVPDWATWPFPYSMGWQYAPLGAYSDHWCVHAHVNPPPLRSATVRNFMVGFEMFAAPQRDLTPEQAARELHTVAV